MASKWLRSWMMPETEEQSPRSRWDNRYRTGPTPWDTQITPPEVHTFWQRHQPDTSGCALDMGCGPGTNSMFLARLGLHVLGIDISGAALAVARARMGSLATDIAARIHFLQSDVVKLPLQRAGAQYILDVGCLHGLRPEERNSYADNIRANLAMGGHYHLFAFDRQPASGGTEDYRGMGNHEVESLFAPDLEIDEVLRGEPDHRPCRWYLLRKTR